MWPHWSVLQHAVITDVRRPILQYLPNTPSNSSCLHYSGAPNYHQGPWSHKLQEFSRIQNSLSDCSDLVYLQIREINFTLFTFSLYRDLKTYTLFIGEKWSQTCDWGWTVSRVPTLVWYCICKIITWLTGRVVLFWRWTVREWKEDGGLATTPRSKIELWTQTCQSDPAGLLGHITLGLILLLPPSSSHSCIHLGHNPDPHSCFEVKWDEIKNFKSD